MTETRVLLITLEYADAWLFSGNGVYCRAFVNNICKQQQLQEGGGGGAFKFLVICGRPASATANSNGQEENVIEESAHVRVLTVPLPVWFKLDRQSSWKEFALGGAKLHGEEVSRFAPHLALGVDWTSKLAFERLNLPPALPLCFLCFRCFSVPPNCGSEEDATFYGEMEGGMLNICAAAVALSSCDAKALEALLKHSTASRKRRAAPLKIQIIPPPLRDDLYAMASIPRHLFGVNYITKPRFVLDAPSTVTSLNKVRVRKYITCVCRIVQCKEVLRGFVEVCEHIKDFITSNALVPYLVGPSFDGDEGYSLQVYQRLKRAFPGKQSLIRSEFVGAAQLANIFQQTVINIHPARQEPFGMTIIEAAAFAVPTLMHCEGVGAADLLPASQNLCVGSDFANTGRTALVLKSALKQRASYLQLVGARAQQAVLQWDSTRWAQHVKRELLLPNRSQVAVQSPQASAPVAEEEAAAWPWPDIAIFAGVRDAALVQRRVENWLARHTVDTFSALIRKRKRALVEPFEITPDMFQWGNAFCETSAMLRDTRFRFVPGRISERTFWGVFFLCLCEVCSDRPKAFAELERAVQFDDSRGIQTMARALQGGSQLQQSALAIARDADRVLLLTGFPCCNLGGSRSLQETDGPPGAVSLARALVALGKQVHLCIERVSASVLQACLAAAFTQSSAVEQTRCGTELIRFGGGGLVVLEIFPNAREFTQYERVEELKLEFSERNRGHLIAIERAGPGRDGKCRTMRGRELLEVAPLHLLFESALARTTGIGDGGNEVGMGNLHDLQLPSKESACVTESTFLLPCSVSNWGALALCAALAFVEWIDHGNNERRIEPLLDSVMGQGEEVLERELKACVEMGAADGITQEPDVLTVDGMPFSETLRVVQILRNIVLDWAAV